MEQEIGKVSHYFGKLNVAIVDLKKPLKQGETVHFVGHTSDFTQPIDSMQLEHEEIEEGKSGQSIGIKVVEHAREGDAVYKVKD